MNCQQKSTCQDNVLASDNQVKCLSKELRGLSSCQDPHTSTLSVFGCQQTNKHTYSLNAANQVAMGHHLSCYRMFHCFRSPSLILLDDSAKSVCLGELSPLSLLSRQVKMAILFSKITKFEVILGQLKGG